MMSRLFAFLFIGLAALFGQTKPGIDQLKGKPGTTVQLWAVKTDGSLSQIKLGSGLTLTADALTGQLILSIDPSVIAPAGSTRVYSEPATMSLADANTWTVKAAPIAGTEEVYLNGIHQKAGFDYDLAGNAVTFRKVCLDSQSQPISCIGSTPTIVVSYSR